MPLRSIVRTISDSSLAKELLNRAKRKETLLLNGGNRISRAIVSSAIARIESRPLLIIVPTLEEASRWLSLLQSMGWGRSFIYPSRESSPYEPQDLGNEIIWGQLQVLSELISKKTDKDIAVVATERCLQPHLAEPKYFESQCHTIAKGQEWDLELLSEVITKLGYKRIPSIDQEGTWSRRGDIVDIFPVSSELPVRLEFFGDSIEKIREFDPISQKCLDTVNEICLTPTSLNPLISSRISENDNLDLSLYTSNNSLEEYIEDSTTGDIGRLLGIAWEEPYSLLDYLQSDTCVVIDEKDTAIRHSKVWIEHVISNYQENFDSGIKLPPNQHLDSEESINRIKSFFGFELSEIKPQTDYINTFDLSSRHISIPPNNFSKLAQDIKDKIKSKNKIWILSAQPSRTVSLLEEHDCVSTFVSNDNDYQSINKLVEDNTPVALKISSNIEIEGLLLPAWSIYVLTDREIYGQHNFLATGYVRRRKKSVSRSIDPNKMQEGDLVVHRNHGIGKFIKIEKHAINGEVRDYLVVQYMDGKLSVAADQLNSLGRYRATNSKSPAINKLGGKNWETTKKRVQKHLQKLAIDLIRLYAERSKQVGFSFPPDGPWQNELEDSFPYEPTPDQLSATTDIKRDMESPKPMDRLVCGDVGFGKTEVAIRAIFKAITSGKQVALLAPTTVLTQQHWRTIKDRFAPYPINISLLNRFRSSEERKNIISGIKEGNVDAVVGTHQLLSNKIQFKDLGLLVVDEEQRFGVNQKEKIKQLKNNIDVLTLSATPIPRTLYMSLSGVREMSLITTPPPSRRAIKTHLSSMDDEVIRSAICQEMDRGGQIFYVVPRVEGIEEVATKLNQMISNIRLIVAHGQMKEGELESAMIAFNSGEADLMLCTTIIESGLDIPRVNTILIEDSHTFGLSQLYQLRGRVGRSGIQAHAWLFYPEIKSLSEAARKRLVAIQEFADLGSGYQLAMRDMEIRGVGNILGVEQSGQMEAIGFDLYMEMLQESLAEIQGQDIPKVDDTQIDLQVTAFIPGDWIINNEEKISAYRSVTLCLSKEELIELASIWNDRYGNLPKPVQTLIEIMNLKISAKKCGFTRIRKESQNIILETKMEDPAFRVLRKGLPQHLHSRFIFKKSDKKMNEVVVRGIGSLIIEKQIETLIEWFEAMHTQISSENILI